MAITRSHVVVLRESAQLEDIVPAWEDLARNAVEPNPFYEHWMLLRALRWLEQGAGLRCATVWLEEGGKKTLCGLFPFHSPRPFGGLPLARISSYRHPHWLLSTPLVRAGRVQECLHALLDWFARDGEGASLLEFRYVPCDGPVHSAIADALRERDMMVIATDSFSRAVLRQSSDPDPALDERLPREFGKELRRKERRLREHGVLAHRVLRLEGDAERWIQDFLRLEASGWKGRNGSALACKPGDRSFATQVMREAFQRGQLMMVGYDLDRRPIARCCNFTAGEAAFAFRSAFDEAFARFSPGVMAEVATVRQFHALRRLRWMDSLTDPGNQLLNRLWNGRRMFQTLLVGSGALGELALSGLPLARWAKRRWTGARPAAHLGGRPRQAAAVPVYF